MTKNLIVWNLEKAGYIFNCSYEPKNDLVSVMSYQIAGHSKSALARNSGEELIAHLLADEIIIESGLKSDN